MASSMPPVEDTKKMLPYAGMTVNDIEQAKLHFDVQLDGNSEQIVRRMIKRQTAVRLMVERCVKHQVEIPARLSWLVGHVNDVHEARQTSKRSFETLMFEVREEISEKLKWYPLVIN